jgi:hypothetical protein
MSEKLKPISDSGGADWWPFNTNDATRYLRGKVRGDEVAGKIVFDYLDYLRENNLPINYLDIAGKARFKRGLANHNYSFSFSRGWRWKSNDRTFFVGDLMSGNSFDKMVDELKEKGVKLNFVSFNPLGGLIWYSAKRLSKKLNISIRRAEQILLLIYRRRLRKLLEVMAPGGLIYLGENAIVDYQFKDEDEQTTFMSDFLRKSGFNIIYSSERFSRFIIKK